MIPTLLLAALLTLPGPTPTLAYNGCSAWHSQTIPPRVIRVLIGHHVERVPFALYSARVVSSEWNTVPTELRKAGAVAVRQYGWWKAMRPRHSRYGCFDVHSTTQDQIYRSHKTPPDYIWAAVRQTWSWRVLREGRLVMTGYRTGRAVGCAGDVDGYHLFARSAARCARLGWGAQRLLSVYYNGRVTK